MTIKNNLIRTALIVSLLTPLYGYAEGVSTTTVPTPDATEVSSTTEATSTEALSPIDVAARNFTLCSQEAIENRDTKIATSRSIYNTAMANALTERKNKEKAAVAMTSETKKKNAIKASVETYKNMVKVAQNNLTESRKIAWQDFEDDLTSCRDIQAEELAVQEELASPRVTEITEEGDTGMPLQEARQEKRSIPEEGNTLKETIKAGFDSLKSLFN